MEFILNPNEVRDPSNTNKDDESMLDHQSIAEESNISCPDEEKLLFKYSDE